MKLLPGNSKWILITLFFFKIYLGYSQNGTPYQTVSNHLNNLDDENRNEEAAALSFPPQYTVEKRIQFAQELKHLFDAKGLDVNLSSIPKDSNYTDSTSMTQEFRIFLKKYPELFVKKYGDQWYYSIETCEKIHILYREVIPQWADEVVEALPGSARKKYLGIALWQYVGIGEIILLIFLLHFVLSWMVDKILEKSVWEKIHIGKQHHKTLYKLAKYLSLIMLMALIKRMLPLLMLSAGLSSFLHKTIDILQIIFIVTAAMQIVSIIRIYLMLMAEKTETKMDDQLIPLLMKSLKIVIGFVAFMHLLSLLGVNVTALIAGASIGGLAIALAAQDTFKNLFGSIMIFLDKPFQIGDFITTSEIEGTIERIGFRSTRIRKIDTSVISVPNGNLANVTLTNLGIRKFRILETTISILYSTDPAKIRDFLDELRKIPPSELSVQPDTWLVYLRHLSASSIDIYFRSYIEAPDFKTELSIREHIIFSIMEAAKKAGVSFAYPSTSVYLERTDFTEKLAGHDKSAS